MSLLDVLILKSILNGPHGPLEVQNDWIEDGKGAGEMLDGSLKRFRMG